MDLSLQKALFRASSALTRRYPVAGARLLNTAIKFIVTHPTLDAAYHKRNQSVLDHVGQPKTILVLADIHLGDAVMLQGLVVAARDYFPASDIHYVIARSARPFIEGHPDVTHLWPIYTGSSLPNEQDFAAVRDLIVRLEPDLVINACPSFVPGRPLPNNRSVLDFLTRAPRLIWNDDHPTEPNHFLFQSYEFLAGLFARRWPNRRPGGIRGASIYLDDDAVDAAGAFVDSLATPPYRPWVLLNPDGASPYTRPPQPVLASVLDRLVAAGMLVMIGEGHTDAGVGRRLRDGLSPAARRRTRLVPGTLPAPAYAALIDRMDGFVSGDTGPLHWAAARKVSRSGCRSFRNRTAVFALFGATPARMSGYDSSTPGFLPAWQDAVSATFVSHAPCLNITCLNKLHKTCATVRCFEGCSPLALADAVTATIGMSWHVRAPEPVRVPA
jgi:ADP-heptose:LPS heptosyltransferase